MPLTLLDWRRSHHQAIGPIRARVIPTVAGALRQAQGTLTAGSGHIDRRLRAHWHYLQLLAHRAWNPPPSSSVAEEEHLCSLLLRAAARIPDARSCIFSCSRIALGIRRDSRPSQLTAQACWPEAQSNCLRPMTKCARIGISSLPAGVRNFAKTPVDSASIFPI